MNHDATDRPEAPVPPSDSTPAAAAIPTTPGDDKTIVAPRREIHVDTSRYRGRFAAVYTVLGLVLVGAIVGLVALVIRPGQVAGPAWSSWKPKSGNAQNVTKQIADRVAARYRLSEEGGQLVAIIPSGATITSGTAAVPLKAIAVRKAPQSNDGIRIIDDTSGTRMFTLCGLGKNCSIEGGKASAQRGRLVRREALEAALYTFKFAPAVNSVIAFMPPAPGATTTSVLFLEKSALAEQLSQPLSKTLPLATPPLPQSEDLAEAATIDRLTLGNPKKGEPTHMFSYELTAIQTGGAAIVLDPAS
jgi:hypothetical protein